MSLDRLPGGTDASADVGQEAAVAGSRVEITGSAPVEEGGRGRLTVAFVLFARRDGDVAELELEVEHDAGVLTGRLTPPPVEDGAGRGTVDLDARALPAGRALVRITPRGRRDEPGEPGVLPIAIAATGSDPTLQILTFEPVQPEVARPGARSVATPGFDLAWQGAGGAVVHVTVEGPDGRAAHGVATAPEGGRGRVTPVTLDARAAAGDHRVTARLVGEDGSMSDPATATVRVGGKGVSAPRVERLRWRGRAGELVVRGEGLDGPGLAVLLDGAPAPVAEVSATELVVRAAGLVEPALLEVRTDYGAGRARAPIAPRVGVEILPEEPVLPEGETVELRAVVRGSRDGRVAWTLEGAAADVELTGDGLLTAAHGAPETVVVRAASIADPSASATATVRVIPPLGGPASIGSRGGTVASADGRATLTVPPGALAEPVAIDVRPRRVHPTTRGETLAAEVRLSPAALAGEAELVLTLDAHATPGSTMEVLAEQGGAWVPVGEALVDVQGMTATVTLTTLPDRIRLRPEITRVRDIVPVGLSAPVITGVEGSPPVEEGATVAVLVSGANFVPGATYVSVRLADAVDARIVPGGAAVTRDGTRLATTIRVDPIPELPGPATTGGTAPQSAHMLRVQTPAGTADFPFPILGRNEIRVRAGEVVAIGGPVRLSRLDVDTGGRLDVAATVPPVTIDVLGQAEIWGDVRVVAADGATGGTPASGSTPGASGAGGTGAAPFNAGGGGAGGAGGLIGVGPPAATMGATGSAGQGTSPGTLGAGGAGGLGSNSAGWGPFPHGGEPGLPGASAPNPHPIFPGASSFVPGFAPGAGGGGGGGGGGEGLLAPGRPGGGGGGGGAGGGAVRIAAGRELWTYGNVLARGGNGGRGGRGSGDFWISAGHGGSGGGGGGGSIHLSGLSRGHGALAATSGSTPRAVGAGTAIEARTALQIALDSPPTGEIRVDGYMIGACRPSPTPGPDLFHTEQLVATVPDFEVRGLDANFISVRNGEDEEHHPIGPEHVFPNGITSRNSFFVRTVPLRPGFNYIRAQRWLEDHPFPMELNGLLMESTDVRVRRVYFLPDTIGAYEFACTLAPATLTAATERSATIAATVTASQQTGLMWSVDGGADFGSVTPTSAGARYTAPSRAPAGGARVRAASSVDPGRYVTAAVDVLPGIRITSVAAAGTPAVSGLPSANAGQVIDITIPPEVYALTTQGFGGVQVEFEVLRPKMGGGCERALLPVAATVAPGLLSLTATVPACAAPRGWVRVPGHGSAELQIVPTVSSFDGDRAAEPDVTVRGNGFGCGQSDVLVGGSPVAADSVTCGSAHLSQWPLQGAALVVRTVGGSSPAVIVP